MNLLQPRHYKISALILSVGFFVLSYFVFSLGPLGGHDYTVDDAVAASETISCNATGSRTLTAGTYSNSDGSQFTTGADLTLNVGTGADCTFTFNGTMTVASLVVDDGVTLTHSANTSTQVYTLDIQSTGTVTINAGAAVTADGKGYAGGTYNTSIGNGAGYGGGISSGFGGPGTATSTYTDSYSTGDRTAIISVTGTIAYNGNPNVLADGNKTQNVFYWEGSPVSGKYVRFSLSSPRVFTEAIYYQENSASQGIYVWQGSNNATDWTTLGSSFIMGQSTAQTQTAMSTNTVSYSYYQLLGVANNNSLSPWVREFEFKVASVSSGGGGAHYGAGGAGGNSGGTGGSAYAATTTIGSGGGAGGATGSSGGAGGGLIRIMSSSTLTVNGTLSANGATGTVAAPIAGGGGGGGTIYLAASTVTGTPEGVSAVGGAGGDTTYDGGGGGGGYVFVSYANTTTIRSANTSLSGGAGNVSGGSGAYYSLQANAAPTATAINPVQFSTSTVMVTTTVTDANVEATGLITQYSLDGVAWVSSTLRSVAVSAGAVSTSTGLITGIDTNTGSITVTLLWDIIADIPNTADSSVYFRVIPTDIAVSGSAVTSSAFAVDTQIPSAPAITTSAQTLNAATTTIAGTAESGAIITISGGASTATGTATGGNYSISVALTQNATNTLSVTAADLFSNTSTPATVVLVEDSVAPNTPAITTNAQTLNAATTTITGTADGGTTITVSGGASTVTTTATGGNYSVSVSLTQDAVNTISVTAADVAANTSTAATVLITEDSTAPNVPVITTSAQTVDAATTTIAGTAESGAIITISGGASTATGTATGGNYSISVALTQNTANTLSVTASDAAANTSTAATVIITEATTADDEEEESATSTPASGSAAASASVTPALTTIAPLAVPAPPVTQSFPVNTPTPISVGGASHTVTVRAVTNNQVTVLIQSEPVLVTLKNGQTTEIDTDGDKVSDLKVGYRGLVDGKPRLEFVNLVVDERNKPFTINSGAKETESSAVTLNFKAQGVVLVAVSNRADFSDSHFEPITLTRNWTLEAGDGVKTVYARFRTSQGQMITVSDTIVKVVGSLLENKAESVVKNSVFTRELKLLSTGEDVRQLQIFLKNKGYFAHPEFTTKFGSVTQVGLRKYQANVGLKVTGVLDAATRMVINTELSGTGQQANENKKLSIFTRELKLLSIGEDVRQLQIFLKNKGYFAHPEFTTKFGSATQIGLKKYQQSVKLKPTGILDTETRSYINQSW